MLSNMPTEDDVPETKKKVGLVEFYFHLFSKNIVVFDKAPWESPALNNLFAQKKKNQYFENSFFFSVSCGTKEKKVLQFS